MNAWVLSVQEKFAQSFIEDDRWKYIVNGLGVTLQATIMALLLGVAIGIVLAVIRTAYEFQRSRLYGIRAGLLRLGNALCKVYLTVIRGTPVMVQLLIMNFVIMKPQKEDLIWCAVLTFGINSGAYVAEIVRSGIMSISHGQMEAGRSLGLPYGKTMRYIIIPQAIKNILPALGNEMITLLKETSIVTVIGLVDMTKGAMIIQGRTFQAFMPLLAIAVIYLILVMVLTWLLGKLERRLAASDRR